MSLRVKRENRSYAGPLPKSDQIPATYRIWRMWDWRCSKCSITGSCPIDAGKMVDDAVELVAKHHGTVNRECNLEFGVDHIELLAVVSYRSKGKGVPPERVGWGT